MSKGYYDGRGQYHDGNEEKAKTRQLPPHLSHNGSCISAANQFARRNNDTFKFNNGAHHARRY